MRIETQLREELAGIVEAVTFFSASAFTFAGRSSSPMVMPMIGLQLTPDMPPLMSELTGQLYQHCFSNRFRAYIAHSETPHTANNDTEWIEVLSRANRSRERWEDDWQVVQSMPNGQVMAKRGATTRTLTPGEFVNLSGSGNALPPGAALTVFVPRESRTSQAGYYFAFGETSADSNDESSIIRFYWNVSIEGAAELLQLISVELNRWQVPFRFKTISNRAIERRSDSAVLYTPRRYASFVFEIVLEIHRRVRQSLREDVPLFTLHLGRGLAFAEDPGTQESFGMSRCRMLAHGMWLAYQQGAQNTDERLAIVEQRFRTEGISLERPWLNSGSADDFRFTVLDAEAA